jgi:hypothetical protein
MGNERFLKGELGTHFIDREVTLIDDMKRIAEQEQSLREKLPVPGEEKKKIAAIAVASAMAQVYSKSS